MNQQELTHALDLHQRSYRLLRWMGDAVERGFISFDTAHEYSTLPEATEDWILGHFQNIPPDARPPRDAMSEFCAYFSTFLENSYALVAEPETHLFSEDGHCFCPNCSWMRQMPHLQPRKLTSADKKRARRMKATAVRELATEQNVELTAEAVDAIVDDPDLREAVSLVTWTQDLPRRGKGVTTGPAVLALWRGFAWKREGSRNKDFKLTVELVLESEARVRAAIGTAGGSAGTRSQAPGTGPG